MPPATIAPGPPLSPETLRRLEILFLPADRERAAALLTQECGNNLPFLNDADMFKLERFRFAAMKYSDGDLARLERAVSLAQRDWRDLLMATGFANDTGAHRRWEPKPAGEPALIDPAALSTGIHSRLARLLGPLGFAPDGGKWSRPGEVPQSLTVQTGLTSRTETKFFLHARLEANPVAVVAHLPRLPKGPGALTAEQGYVFRAGDNPEALCAAVTRDVELQVVPWFQRFTTPAEVERGFADKTFHPHLRVGNQALIF